MDTIPDYTPTEDKIYFSSNLNNYLEGDPEYVLHKNTEDKWEITVTKPEGYPWNGFYYYFTRGSIKTIESDSIDFPVLTWPFIYWTESGTIKERIFNWNDRIGKPSTASWNVSRISEEFPMPQLGRTRGISIYLPPDYNNSENYYPVVYLHDGHVAFDKYTSLITDHTEWGLDEVLNKMASEGIKVPIVVAIDNGGYKRWDELSPWKYTNPYFWGSTVSGGEGDQYIDFIINTLKPHIDSTYRTLSGPENSCLMGSSLGGLITFYGAMKRPDVFCKAGIFSPSYWVSDSVWQYARDAEKVHPMRLYHLVGSLEVEGMISNVNRMNGMLRDLGFSEDELNHKVVEGGQHHKFLGSEFRETYLWLFPEAASSAKPILSKADITVYPNPASKILYFDTSLPLADSKVSIYSITGAMVKNNLIKSSHQIDISDLPEGVYILKITGTNINFKDRFVKE